VVVLAVHPRRVGQQGQEVVTAVRRGGQGAGVVGQARVLVGGSGQGPAVERGVLAEGHGRHVAEDGAVEAVEDAQPPGGAGGCLGDLADHGGADLPLGAHRLDALEVLRRDDGQHALLALGGHHLVVDHPGLAPRHGRHVDVHAHAAAGRRLAGGAHEARAAEVLDADHELGVEQLEARLDQPLLLVGVADLHARALGRLLGLVAPAEPGRGEHADPADAVATGGRAEQHGQVARSRGLPQHQAVGREDAHAQHVDQWVLAVAGVEGLAPDRRHAHRVAVAGDAGDDALDEPLLLGSVGSPKRRGSITAMGRAPMVKMSRRMPPTPVAAPW
jgi:hypothetical protein